MRVPRDGETWSAPDGFVARVVKVWPESANPHGPPWANVAYRRAGGGPLVNMRIDRFLYRFSRLASTPTGPFE